MKNLKYSVYSFMLKIQNSLKNKGVKNDNKVFIINESNQQMYEKNPTGKKLYVDKDGLPTLDIKEAKDYKWIPFLKGSGRKRKINPFFSLINYIRSYAFESDVITCFKYATINKVDNKGNNVLDKDGNPIMINTLIDVDSNNKAIPYSECDIVLTYELKQTFQSKSLYEFNPSSDDINSLSDDTIKSDDDTEIENFDSLQF